MHARTSTLQGDPGRIDEAIEQYRSALSRVRELSGNQGAGLLVDRSSGKGISITLWDNEQAMTESREQANQLREQAAEQTAAEIVSVEEYEVAVWEAS
jgi:heme-degrading monooxygenase HmoA